jgi:hypothetical protein
MKKALTKKSDGGGTKSVSPKETRLTNKVIKLGKLEQSIAKDTGKNNPDAISRYNAVAGKLNKAVNKLDKTISSKKMGGATKKK